MPKLCCEPETTMVAEINDSDYRVAAVAGDDMLTNLAARNRR
jgi:hypothetical protein